MIFCIKQVLIYNESINMTPNEEEYFVIL